MPDSRFQIARPRIYLNESLSIGPGKIALLRKIDELRSITAAAKALDIPYKRAWSLIETLNVGFNRPVVQTSSGGKGGGGAAVTELGHALIVIFVMSRMTLRRYREALHGSSRPQRDFDE